jgi:DNA-binding GntR family transcriptional regulator
MRRLLLKPSRTDKTITEHKEVLAALAARDADRAANAMRKHLGNVLDELRIFAEERPELFEP